MLHQALIKDLERSTLNIAPLQKLVVELNESSEESLSAGSIAKYGIKYPVIVRLYPGIVTHKLTHLVQ